MSIHEDFDELDRLVSNATLTPVDVFGRILYLRSGKVLDWPEADNLGVAAVGGAPEREGDPRAKAKRDPRIFVQPKWPDRRQLAALLGVCPQQRFTGRDRMAF